MVSPSSERNEKGRYESNHGVTVEDVFDSMDPLEPYTTGELADKVGAPRRTVYHYLEQLYEENRLKKKKPAPRRVIWMRGQ